MQSFKSESEFSKWCINKGHEYGWKVARFHRLPSPGGEQWRTPFGADAKGWLDLTFCRERLVFAELKHGHASPTREQRQWIEWLRSAGQEVYLWKDTGDLGEIEAVLKHTMTPADIARITLDVDGPTIAYARTTIARAASG